MAIQDEGRGDFSDKLSLLSRLFVESEERIPADGGPPLTRFLRYVWLSNGRPKHDSTLAEERAKFVFWYLDKHVPAWRPYGWPLPPALLEWLNAPVFELSEEVAGVPGLRGDVPCGKRKYLTRFMEDARTRYEHKADVGTPAGLLEFYVWFAADIVAARGLPAALLPAGVIEVLNTPADGSETPLTVGMLAFARRKRRSSDGVMKELRGAELIALCLESLKEVARTGDPRLVPGFVSSFWGSPAPGGKTRLGYVTKMLREATPRWAPPPETGPGGDVTGMMGEQRDSGRRAAQGPSLRPAPRLVVSYRDRKTVCGLGISGAAVVEALRQSGAQIVDLDYSLPRDRNRSEWLYNKWCSSNAKRKLHLFLINPESVLRCVANHFSRFGESDTMIGRFFWELSDTSAVHDEGIRLMDEIWVASDYARQIYQRRSGAPVLNMGNPVQPAAAGEDLNRSRFGLPEGHYLFLMNFDARSIVERKNPLGTIQAFECAFPRGDEAAGLVIKTRNTDGLCTQRDRWHWGKVLERARQDPRIRILGDTLSSGALAALYMLTDCYVSLHRSEGFGQAPAEAMYYGKPVIVTAYSGVTDFCTPETARLVDYRLVEVRPEQYPYVDADRRYEWAEPNLGTAARHMRELYEDRQTASRLALAGQRLIRSQYSVEACRRRYAKRLSELGYLWL